MVIGYQKEKTNPAGAGQLGDWLVLQDKINATCLIPADAKEPIQ